MKHAWQSLIAVLLFSLLAFAGEGQKKVQSVDKHNEDKQVVNQTTEVKKITVRSNTIHAVKKAPKATRTSSQAQRDPSAVAPEKPQQVGQQTTTTSTAKPAVTNAQRSKKKVVTNVEELKKRRVIKNAKSDQSDR